MHGSYNSLALSHQYWFQMIKKCVHSRSPYSKKNSQSKNWFNISCFTVLTPILVKVMAWCLQASSHHMLITSPQNQESKGICTFDYVIASFECMIGFFFFKWGYFSFQQDVNPLWPGDTIWCRRPCSAVVQVIACRLLGAIPLPKPMLSYCQLDTQKQTVKL